MPQPPPVRATFNMPQLPLPEPGKVVGELMEPATKLLRPEPLDIAIFLMIFGLGVAGSFMTAISSVAVHRMAQD